MLPKQLASPNCSNLLQLKILATSHIQHLVIKRDLKGPEVGHDERQGNPRVLDGVVGYNNQGALVVKLPAMFFAVASTYTGAHEMFSGCYDIFSPACHVLISTALGLIGSCVYLLLSSVDRALLLRTTVHNTTPTTMECLRFFHWINYID